MQDLKQETLEEEVDELFNLNTKLPREVNRKYLQQLLLKIRKDA